MGYRMTRKQRREVREAKKKRRFEAKREKLRNRRRAPKYIICLALAAACSIIAMFHISVMVQLYAAWKYETTLNVLELPAVTSPCYLNITIEYEGKRPSEIYLSNNNERLPDEIVDVTDDYTAKIVKIGLDTKTTSNSYKLNIRPEDNLELKYRTSLDPSYKYLECNAKRYRGENGDYWIDLTCSFKRLKGRGFKCILRGLGDKYAVTLYDGYVPQNVIYPLNISEIAGRTGTDISRCDRYLAEFSLDATDAGLETIPVSIDMLSEWPQYDPNEKHSYSKSNTEAYLDAIS